MKGALLMIAGAGLFLSSCADLMKVPTIKPKVKEKSRFSDDGGEGGLGGIGGNPNAKIKKINEDVAVGTAPVKAGYLPPIVGEGVVAGGMKLPSDKSIVWAPMKSNADVPFGEAFKPKPKSQATWLMSYKEARRESMRTGKPILIWFTTTGSPGSPMCARLNRELFATNDFAKWAKENLIRLKIDASGGKRELDDNGNLAGTVTSRRKYAAKLKKQYHVLGYPSLVVLQPDGAVYRRERGFSRGGKNELWGKLKNAVLTIDHNQEIWERQMSKKGYRRWSGKDVDQVVFGKLVRFDEKSGSVWLTEPDGNTIKTSTKSLSKADRAWILAEKERRGH